MNRKLLTAEGYQRLQDELNDLVRKERPEITAIVSWAASLGDRSENADYHYNKRKLREIDRRIRYLTKLFEVAHKVEYSPEQDGKAYSFKRLPVQGSTTVFGISQQDALARR